MSPLQHWSGTFLWLTFDRCALFTYQIFVDNTAQYLRCMQVSILLTICLVFRNVPHDLRHHLLRQHQRPVHFLQHAHQREEGLHVPLGVLKGPVAAKLGAFEVLAAKVELESDLVFILVLCESSLRRIHCTVCQSFSFSNLYKIEFQYD